AEAARHLFSVAAGLDSMVLGETEITGQIKNAYETAREAEVTGPVLNRLFQKAFQTTKEIRPRTAIGRGTVSIKGAAVELIEKAFSDDLANKSVMVIGAGEMAERCIQLLVKKGVRSIFVSSRSFDRAIDLATRCGGDAVCFGDCLFEMRDVDVVVAATSSGQTLLVLDDIENLMKARCNRPLLLIDLSVPRNIDPAPSQLENVTLSKIDDVDALPPTAGFATLPLKKPWEVKMKHIKSSRRTLRLLVGQIFLAISVAQARNDAPPSSDKAWLPPKLSDYENQLAGQRFHEAETGL